MRRHVNDKRKSGLLLFLPIFFTLSVFSCDKVEPAKVNAKAEQIDQNKSVQPKTYSSQFREVQINNHVLLIPNYYIGQNPGHGEFVSMYTYWPDLVPHQQLNVDKSKYDRLDIMEILLSGRDTVSQSPQGDLYELLKQDNTLRTPFYNKKLGMWEYQKRLALDDVSRGRLYVSTKDSVKTPYGRPLTIRCYGIVRIKNDPGSIQCNVDYFIRDNLLLKYRFFYKHINDWESIDLQVRSLVESFFKGE